MKSFLCVHNGRYKEPGFTKFWYIVAKYNAEEAGITKPTLS